MIYDEIEWFELKQEKYLKEKVLIKQWFNK